MDISLHINTDNPVDVAQARAVLDFVDRGLAGMPTSVDNLVSPALPAEVRAATKAVQAAATTKPPRKPRASTKNAVKAAVNGRGAATDSGELTLAAVAQKVADAGPDANLVREAAAPDFSTPDAAARAVHAKNTKVADVLDLLAPFKVTRVSELSKEQGPEFIAAAKKFLGVA